MRGIFKKLFATVISTVLNITGYSLENKKIIYRNKMYSERILNEVLDFLEQKKYPVGSFDLNCPISKYFQVYSKDMQPDLTILNEETLQPLAFFRVYENQVDFQKDKVYDAAYHLSKHSNILMQYPYYVVIMDNLELQFYNLRSVILRGEKKLEISDALEEPIKYEIMQNNDFYRIVHNQLIGKNKLHNLRQIISFIVIPVVGIIVLILDGLGYYTLSETRLRMILIIIVSFLIPYLAQINVKDISIIFKERKRNK